MLGDTSVAMPSRVKKQNVFSRANSRGDRPIAASIIIGLFLVALATRGHWSGSRLGAKEKKRRAIEKMASSEHIR